MNDDKKRNDEYQGDMVEANYCNLLWDGNQGGVKLGKEDKKRALVFAKGINITLNPYLKLIYCKDYKGVVSFHIMPSSYIKKLIAEAGYLADPILVRDNDEFRWDSIISQEFKRVDTKPKGLELVMSGGKAVDIKGLQCGAFNVIRANGSVFHPQYVEVSEILKSVNSSHSLKSEFSPWRKHTEAMVVKTLWMKLGKRLAYFVNELTGVDLQKMEDVVNRQDAIHEPEENFSDPQTGDTQPQPPQPSQSQEVDYEMECKAMIESLNANQRDDDLKKLIDQGIINIRMDLVDGQDIKTAYEVLSHLCQKK